MQIFNDIYKENRWASDESVSGHGSTIAATAEVRFLLPMIFEEYQVGRVLDIPCGDFNWWQHMNGIDNLEYIGADVVPELIRDNTRLYANSNRIFVELDVTKDNLPRVDMVVVRDLLGHFNNRQVQMALHNLRLSGSKYLLATTYPLHENSGDIETGDWRPINLAQFFGLPDPIRMYSEQLLLSGFEDKYLGLWQLRDEF